MATERLDILDITLFLGFKYYNFLRCIAKNMLYSFINYVLGRNKVND